MGNVTSYTFQNCSNLTTISATNSIKSITSAYQMFMSCVNLTSVTNVLKGNTNITTAQDMYYACYNLSSIGAEHFKGCSSLQNLGLCFYNNVELKTISSTVFSGCIGVTSLNECFRYSGLVNIPSGLFRDMAALSTAVGCFWRIGTKSNIGQSPFPISSIVPSDLFNPTNNPSITNTNILFNGVNFGGFEVPKLWEYAWANLTSFNSTYTGVSNNGNTPLDIGIDANQNGIPDDWE